MNNFDDFTRDTQFNQLLSMSNSELRTLRHNRELYDFLQLLTNFLPPNAGSMQRIWHVRNNTRDVPLCITCNTSHVKWTTSRTGTTATARYTKHCSNACRAKDPSVEEKRRSTCVERYGHDKSLTTSSHVAKTRESCLANHGCEFPLQSEGVRLRADRALVEKYGQDANKAVRALAQQSLTEHYGSGSFGEMLNRDPIVHEKKRRTRIDNWLPTRLDGLAKLVRPLFSSSEYENTDQPLPWECIKCSTTFTDCLADGRVPRCPVCFPLNRVNWNQQEVVDYVRSITTSPVLESVRTVITPKELDIFLPDEQVAIEYNGLYWHSELRHKEPKTHIKFKTDECNKLGLRLIHVYEDEWKFKVDIVKSIIRRAIGVPAERVVYGRKCSVFPIDPRTANEFLDEHHIQGRDRASVRYGMYSGDELVGVMTFGKSRFDKTCQWELYRLAFKMNVAVVGGAMKMFRSFVKEYQPSSISTYSDRRLFTGAVYSLLGFENKGHTAPNYYYVHAGSGCSVRYSRQRFQKHKLVNVLNTFDPSLSESQNMLANGYGRIWDAGNVKWIWRAQ